MREIEEIVPDDDQSLSDEIEHDAGDIDHINDDTDINYSNASSNDSNMLSYAGAGFGASPMLPTYSPIADIDMNLNMVMPSINFSDMLVPCEIDVLSQAAGMYNAGDMFYDGPQTFQPQQAAAYGP
jgi:hypothetical protein